MNGPTLQQSPAIAAPSASQPMSAAQSTGPALDQSTGGPTPAADGSANSFLGPGGVQSAIGFSFGAAPTAAGVLPGGFTSGSAPASGAASAAANAHQVAGIGAAAPSAASSAAFTFGSTGRGFHAALSELMSVIALVSEAVAHAGYWCGV